MHNPDAIDAMGPVAVAITVAHDPAGIMGDGGDNIDFDAFASEIFAQFPGIFADPDQFWRVIHAVNQNAFGFCRHVGSIALVTIRGTYGCGRH